MSHMTPTVQPIIIDRPYVDLTLSPYLVRADNPERSVRLDNSAGINSAIEDFSGRGAVLLLPLGAVYVEEHEGNHCVKFGAGVNSLSMVGHGPHATQLVQHATGDGGELNLVVIDGATDIEISGLTLYQHTITNPDPAQHNHLLCIYNNTMGGVTKNVRGTRLRFGKCIGDAIRLLADDSSDRVRNVRFSQFEMHLDGIVASTPANGRTGARCGIAIQRGPEDVTFSDFYIRGAQNSAIDEEPSGGASTRVTYENFTVDNRIGNTGTAVSLGGSGGGDVAVDGHLHNGHILGGKITMLGGTSGYRLRNLVVDVSATMPADPSEALLLIRSGSAGHDDLELSNVKLRRTGGTAGPCLDVINTGNRTKIRDLHIEQSTNAYPIQLEHNGMLDIDGARLKFSGSTPAVYRGIDVIPVASGGTLSDLRVANVSVSTESGKLHSAVSIQARASRTVSKIKCRDIRSAGCASHGVYVSATAGTVDVNPEISGIDNGTDASFTQVDQGDTPTTTLFPILAGNRNGVAFYTGAGAPTITAKTGSLYTQVDGSTATTLYVNTSAGGSGTTWTPK